jgi:hypothetical protein
MLDRSIVECIDAFNEVGLKQGRKHAVQSNPIDRSKWYIVSENTEWSLYDKWRFNHVIEQYAV